MRAVGRPRATLRVAGHVPSFVWQVTCHPEYDANTFLNDVCILQLQRNVQCASMHQAKNTLLTPAVYRNYLLQLLTAKHASGEHTAYPAAYRNYLPQLLTAKHASGEHTAYLYCLLQLLSAYCCYLLQLLTAVTPNVYLIPVMGRTYYNHKQ